VPTFDDPDTLALLCAFLDGELSAVQERALVTRLEQEPGLQDALDALAEQLSMTHRGIESLADALDGDLLGAVLAGLPADAVPATAEGADVLANLLADGQSSPDQDARLDAFFAADDNAVVTAAASDALAFIDASRIAANAPGDAVSAALARLPELVLARVERTERGYALAAAAADAALSATETDELIQLVGADTDFLGLLQATVHARIDDDGADRAVSEALAAVALSPAVQRLAERAGAAAMQVIAADAARAASVTTTTTTTTTTTASTTAVATTAQSSGSVSVWTRIRTVFSQGFFPLAAASAAAVAFVVIGSVTPDVVSTGPVSQLAEVRRALLEVLEPVVLSHNAMVANAEALPVLSDNGADVEAIDATGTTMVFQTAESNITVIWLAGLDEDVVADGEQGT